MGSCCSHREKTVSFLRLRKPLYIEPAVKCSSVGFESFGHQSPKITDQKLENLGLEINDKKRNRTRRRQGKEHYGRWFNGSSPGGIVPGIVTGGIELWEGKPCADGLFRQRLWGGGFTQILKMPLCWLEHLSLHNETGLNPPGIRVRPVPGLFGVDYSAPGYLIRDPTLSRMKSKIELMYRANGYKKVVVVPHSMGVTYFLHFLKWVETPPPMGGGGGPDWCAKHINAIMNIGLPFLGAPKAVSNILCRGQRSCIHQSYGTGSFGLGRRDHLGNMDWSPEEGHACDFSKKRHSQFSQRDDKVNNSDVKIDFRVKDLVNYGIIISFGKAASILHSSQLPTVDSKEFSHTSVSRNFNFSSREAWTEYDEMSRESIQKIAADKAYTATTLFDLLRFVAPRMMKRAEAHFSHEIADNLDDTKYNHYKYSSNPLEMKLPDALNMEIYCSYGVGIPTERPYVYKLSPSSRCKRIPYQIDSSVDREDNSCLKGGVYFADGHESAPVLSAGFMCAKGWGGRTRFNPSGFATYIREYRNKPPVSLLERRGHVLTLGVSI
ncbi:putative phospholipid:diacylglycerol acyltransferase 2 [Hibiscus syriacus]|uniref:Phospholipid:diacylglycerol acyltransferase 2 n=1 Tax=Hibiscus syriacus TaxID=106335 RepID=A0A6A3CGI8_HIBSY|nr:putative phospholipid:diacylglycerol acyltransferase 2 [Hibiscus syriacus]